MTPEEFALFLRRYIDSMQLPGAMSRLSELSKRSSDGEANHISQQAMACATAAAGDNQRLIALLQAVPAYVATAAASGSMSGRFTSNFSGAAGQQIDHTILDSRITVNTVAIVQYDADPNSLYWAAINAWQGATIAGSMVLSTKNPGGAPANNYPFKWVASNP